MISFATTIALTVIALLMLGLAIRRFTQRKLVSGGFSLISALAIGLAAFLAFSIAVQFKTYQRLTAEQAAADLAFERIAPQHYRVTLIRPGSFNPEIFELYGDEWQLDARILKWKGGANIFGLDSRYRLERLSGRYSNIEQESLSARSVHALNAETAGIDVWLLSYRFNRWLPFVDAIYGSAAYLPMRDAARFRVTVSQSGLIARELVE
jgi:hypothetical protein